MSTTVPRNLLDIFSVLSVKQHSWNWFCFLKRGCWWLRPLVILQRQHCTRARREPSPGWPRNQESSVYGMWRIEVMPQEPSRKWEVLQYRNSGFQQLIIIYGLILRLANQFIPDPLNFAQNPGSRIQIGALPPVSLPADLTIKHFHFSKDASVGIRQWALSW